MQIKTITCHEVYNHGATLQEYALLVYLNSLSHKAEVIHYKPPYLSQHFNLTAVGNPKFNLPLIKQLYILVKLPKRMKMLQRKRAFDKFHTKYIPTGKKLYSSNEELKKDLPEADAFICGSDQIWNSFFQNGKDPAFYLNFVPDFKKKISYAASFAIDKLNEEVKPLVKENVLRLDAVGVRETSGVQILSDLGIHGAEQVLDPVFLLTRKHWNQFTFPIREQFVFVYDFDSNPLIKEIVLKLKKENGYAIYTVNANIDYADKNFYLEGPETFLSLVSQSNLNITNSFHSVAFSLIFNQQLVVVNRAEKINTRMRDLLALFNLQDYLISTTAAFNFWEPIEYSKVNPLIQEKVEASKQFLVKSLEG
ncbi:polysaccharide pyruvyl transferase family protein [Kaistella carnis]|uniref:polysaccharide pyruvyl transferase family protein n=1 Tax=Kaistella carnis TaxID=1241979 RepID=UPI0028ACFF12|nr:polysaccharide pyruvyl transferase family protein [Kaistella carnis]